MLLVKVTIFSMIDIGGKHMGFKDMLKASIKEAQEKHLEEQARIKEMDAQGIPYCPKCKSASVQFLDRRKKLSVGRAVVGSALGPAGAVVGALTSNKRKGVMKCLKCGNEWKLK